MVCGAPCTGPLTFRFQAFMPSAHRHPFIFCQQLSHRRLHGFVRLLQFRQLLPHISQLSAQFLQLSVYRLSSQEEPISILLLPVVTS